MKDLPEKIWAFPPDIFDDASVWQDEKPSGEPSGAFYTRTDIAVAAESAAYQRGLEDTAKRYADTIDSFLVSYEITGNRTNLIEQLSGYVSTIRALAKEDE